MSIQGQPKVHRLAVGVEHVICPALLEPARALSKRRAQIRPELLRPQRVVHDRQLLVGRPLIRDVIRRVGQQQVDRPPLAQRVVALRLRGVSNVQPVPPRQYSAPGSLRPSSGGSGVWSGSRWAELAMLRTEGLRRDAIKRCSCSEVAWPRPLHDLVRTLILAFLEVRPP